MTFTQNMRNLVIYNLVYMFSDHLRAVVSSIFHHLSHYQQRMFRNLDEGFICTILVGL